MTAMEQRGRARARPLRQRRRRKRQRERQRWRERLRRRRRLSRRSLRPGRGSGVRWRGPRAGRSAMPLPPRALACSSSARRASSSRWSPPPSTVPATTSPSCCSRMWKSRIEKSSTLRGWCATQTTTRRRRPSSLAARRWSSLPRPISASERRRQTDCWTEPKIMGWALSCYSPSCTPTTRALRSASGSRTYTTDSAAPTCLPWTSGSSSSSSTLSHSWMTLSSQVAARRMCSCSFLSTNA
mmetsp:Transcript_7362/g.31272  ORF Transcript_7362/g.31272 Transcript_7362/m.31272 type:complete len:241 (+) Transcript_7362:482-1204(+)